MPLTKLTSPHASLLVIDLQEKLVPVMTEPAPLLKNAERLIRVASLLQIPTIATEQYPAGLGPTVAAIKEALDTIVPFEKLLFSACTPAVSEAMAGIGRKQIIVTGIEAHVCVQQTALDLLQGGYGVWLCADAVSSRRAYDRDIALERMRDAGVIITTTESVIFELLGQAGTDQFKQVLKLIK